MSTQFISRRYARAIVELIDEGAKLESGLAKLAKVAALPEVRAVLESPAVPAEKKAAVLIEAAKPNKELKNLVRLLCQRGKAQLLPEIHALVEEMLREAREELVAEVESATDLDEAAQKRLAEALQRRLGKKVKLKLRRDPELLGGFVVRVGDRLIDCSLRRKLEAMRQAIAG